MAHNMDAVILEEPPTLGGRELGRKGQESRAKKGVEGQVVGGA